MFLKLPGKKRTLRDPLAVKCDGLYFTFSITLLHGLSRPDLLSRSPLQSPSAWALPDKPFLFKSIFPSVNGRRNLIEVVEMQFYLSKSKDHMYIFNMEENTVHVLLPFPPVT